MLRGNRPSSAAIHVVYRTGRGVLPTFAPPRCQTLESYATTDPAFKSIGRSTCPVSSGTNGLTSIGPIVESMSTSCNCSTAVVASHELCKSESACLPRAVGPGCQPRGKQCVLVGWRWCCAPCLCRRARIADYAPTLQQLHLLGTRAQRSHQEGTQVLSDEPQHCAHEPARWALCAVPAQ